MSRPLRERNQVIKVIEDAFAEVCFPGPEHRSLFQAEASDNHDTCDQSRDHKGRWQDLPFDHIKQCQWAIPHLDKYGIQYYLPALMSAYLKCADEERLMMHVFDSLFFILSKSNDPKLNDYQKERFSLLTVEQKAAVYRFVLFIKPENKQLLSQWESLARGEDWPK
jgi:hypothetical protein